MENIDWTLNPVFNWPICLFYWIVRVICSKCKSPFRWFSNVFFQKVFVHFIDIIIWNIKHINFNEVNFTPAFFCLLATSASGAMAKKPLANKVTESMCILTIWYYELTMLSVRPRWQTHGLTHCNFTNTTYLEIYTCLYTQNYQWHKSLNLLKRFLKAWKYRYE